ncbi:MAG: Tic22 family protein [Leptolyngbyaceae cyanobacterium]
MLYKIFRRLTSAGLAGMAIAGSTALMAISPAFALSESAILEKLDGIPVFLIVNGDGQSLTANIPAESEGAEIQVPIVFIDSTEAENFLDEAENEGAAIATDARIAVLPLDEVYREASSQLAGPDSLVYIPSAISVGQASEIVEQEIIGVPLYAAVDLENQRYLLTGDNKLPMFFAFEDLQAQVLSLVETNPEIEENIGVEVTTLETILSNMLANDPDNDSVLELVEFIPSSQTVEYLESLSGEGTP